MSYVHLTAEPGSSCGINATDVCNPAYSYLGFIPATIFLVGAFIKCAINFMKTGNFTFNGKPSMNTLRATLPENDPLLQSLATNKVNVETQVVSVAPVLSEKIALKKNALVSWLKFLLKTALIESVILSFLPLPSWVTILIMLGTPLLLTVVLTSKNDVLGYVYDFQYFKFLYRNRDKLESSSDKINVAVFDNYYASQKLRTKTNFTLALILMLVFSLALFLAAFASAISQAIYGQ